MVQPNGRMWCPEWRVSGADVWPAVVGLVRVYVRWLLLVTLSISINEAVFGLAPSSVPVYLKSWYWVRICWEGGADSLRRSES